MNKFLLKIIALAVAVTSCVCLVACNGDGSKKETSAPEVTDTIADETNENAEGTDKVDEEDKIYTSMDYMAEDLSKYITLGQYKGLEISLPEIVVTEEEIDREILAVIDELTTYEAYEEKVTDRVTERGDYVNINFVGTMNGEVFEGGSAEDTNILLGENNGFIDWFEDDLYGIMPGTTVKTTGNFPENYYEELAGKEVTFEITLNHIVGHYTIPEFTDEFVAENTDLDSVQAFRDVVRMTVQIQKEAELANQKPNIAWQEVMDKSEIKEYPNDQVMYYYTSERSYLEEYAANYGLTYEAILASANMTDEDVRAYAESRVKEDLVFYSIIKAEGLEISDEEYAAGLTKYATGQGVSEEELVTEFGEAYIKECLLYDEVSELILAQNTFVEK